MTTTADRAPFPEEFAGEDPERAAIGREYSGAVVELVGQSRAESCAAGRQLRVIHRLWRLQGAALEADRAVRARWVRARGRRGPVPELEDRTVLEVAEEIGPALHLPAVTAVARVEQAIVLGESLPEVLTALENGAIGPGQARVIAETWLTLLGGQLHPASDPRPPVAAVRGLAAVLLGKAPSATVAQLGSEARRLRSALTRDCEQARHRDARRGRRVWVEAEEDGMARLCALLDAATAHAIQHRLGSIAGRVHCQEPPAPGAPEPVGHEPDPEHGTEHGHGPALGDGDGDGVAAGGPRTLGQLRADVLADLLLEGETPEMPGHLRGIRGQVTVTVPALTLLRCSTDTPDGGRPGDPRLPADDEFPTDGELPTNGEFPRSGEFRDNGDLGGNRELTGDGEPGGGQPVPAALPVRWTAPAGCAELAGYGPIPDSMAAQIAAGAPSWTRVLTHPLTGAVLDHDRTTYAVPADLKRRLRARDVTCRFPGCRRAAEACDLDHTIAWAEGGTTAAGNLAHLCPAHHRLKHRHGPLGPWRVEQPAQDGVLVWTSPAGRVHVTYPRDHHPVLSSVRIADPLPEQAPPPDPPRPGRACPPWPPGLPPAAAAILDPPPF